MKWLPQIPGNALAALRRVLERLFQRQRVIVPHPVAAERRHRCESDCPHHENGQCLLCGCAIAAKVHFASEECPDKPARWKRL